VSLTSKQQRIKELLSDIKAVRDKRREVLTGGVSLSISGGSSVTNASLADLATEEARLKRELFQLRGGSMRTMPDFSDGEWSEDY
jgi:hypothetical protein